MATPGPYTSDLEIAALALGEDFAPDGDLGKPAWRGAAQVSFDHDWLGSRRYPEARTAVTVAWTRKYLYLGYHCPYTVLNIYEGEDPRPERVGLWDHDVAEVFVNPEPGRVNHYYEFEVAPNNQWIDLEIDFDKDPFYDWSWNSGFEHATRIDAGARVWTCEMRIPAAAMGAGEIRAGAEWRINFYRIDGPGDDPQRRFLCWSPTLSAQKSDFFHVPERFGRIRFA